MRDINQATLLGTISKEVKMAQGKSGIAIANIPISTIKEGWNGGKDQTTFHTIVCFGDLAELAKSFQLGDRILARGRIQNESYETPEGVRKTFTKITASEMAKCVSEAGESKRPSPEPGGKAPENFPRGESSPAATFPYQDKENDINWNKPEEGADGCSYAKKDGILMTCAWRNPEKPSEGGSIYGMKDGGSEWEPMGSIPNTTKVPFN